MNMKVLLFMMIIDTIICDFENENGTYPEILLKPPQAEFNENPWTVSGSIDEHEILTFNDACLYFIMWFQK